MNFEDPAFENSSNENVLEARRQLLFDALNCFSEKPPTDTSAKCADARPPYFAAVPQETLKSIAGKAGVSVEIVEKVRQEVNKFGLDPETQCVKAMKTYRLLGMGESHVSRNPHRVFGATLMAKLKDAGATHLAIEQPAKSQPIIDAWLKGAKLDPKLLQDILQEPEYIQMLEAAKTAGLKVVCVDNRDCEDDERDGFMAKNIERVLDENEDNKVVFWVGNTHLGKASEGGDDDDEDPPLITCAAELLRNKYSACVFASMTQMQSLSLSKMVADVSRPVSIETNKTKALASFPKFADSVVRFGDWENVILYPR